MARSTIMSRADVDDTTLGEVVAACEVSPDEIEDIYECVHQQQDQMSATRSERFQIVLSFSAEIDLDRWCDALRRVVAVTPVMRTRLVRCRFGMLQVVIAEDHVTERLSGDLEQYLRDDEARPLDFGRPLLRSSFIDRYFVLTIHHVLMDYWSLTNLVKEDVVHAYIGLPIPKRPPFKDFVAHCLSIDETAAKSFWSSRLKRPGAVFPRIDRGYVPYPTQLITKEIILKQLGNGVSLPQLPSFVEAAWALTAAIYADSDSVVYGFVLSGRSPALRGAEATLGPTHCEVPVQASVLRTMTVEQLVSDRAASLRELQARAELQYGLLNIAEVDGRTRAAAGFQTLLNVIPALPTALPTDAERSSAIKFDRLVWRAHGSVALMLRCQIVDGGVRVEARHDAAILSDRHMHRVLSQFEHTLQLLTEVPLQTRLDKLSLLSASDRDEIMRWNGMAPVPVEELLHDMFVAQVHAVPDDVAVEAGDGTARYHELDRMSSQLARELQRRGVLPRDSVAVLGEKSLAAIVAILAVLKAGGTCVPLDKDDPYDHNAAIVAKVNAKVVLISSAESFNLEDLASNVVGVDLDFIAQLPEVTGPLEMDTTLSPQDLAYIIPTSGITGTPRHVKLEHGNLASMVANLAMGLVWVPGSGSRVLQYAPWTSNLSLCEIFGTLLSGGCLCIPPGETTDSTLASFIESAKVNAALLTPSVLRTMSPGDVPTLRSVLSIGEPVDPDASRTWGAAAFQSHNECGLPSYAECLLPASDESGLRFYNGWGACEASMLSTLAGPLSPDSPYPEKIGTAMGCEVWLVNPHNPDELAPIGSVGELWMGGPGVARGYLHDDGPQGSTPITSQMPAWAAACGPKGPRLFRSGDLARYTPDGGMISLSITFVGRMENRVSIGGQTVQLEQIERVLARCEGVKEVVTSTKIAAGRTQLAAVLSLADPRLSGTEVLQPLPASVAKVADERLSGIVALARAQLDADTVPAIWHVVQRLPRTAAGKMDRGAVRSWLKTLGRGRGDRLRAG